MKFPYIKEIVMVRVERRDDPSISIKTFVNLSKRQENLASNLDKMKKVGKERMK